MFPTQQSIHFQPLSSRESRVAKRPQQHFIISQTQGSPHRALHVHTPTASLASNGPFRKPCNREALTVHFATGHANNTNPRLTTSTLPKSSVKTASMEANCPDHRNNDNADGVLLIAIDPSECERNGDLQCRLGLFINVKA